MKPVQQRRQRLPVRRRPRNIASRNRRSLLPRAISTSGAHPIGWSSAAPIAAASSSTASAVWLLITCVLNPSGTETSIPLFPNRKCAFILFSHPRHREFLHLSPRLAPSSRTAAILSSSRNWLRSTATNFRSCAPFIAVLLIYRDEWALRPASKSKRPAFETWDSINLSPKRSPKWIGMKLRDGLS